MLGDQHRCGASQVDQTPKAVLRLLCRHALHGVAPSRSVVSFGHFGLSIKVVVGRFRIDTGISSSALRRPLLVRQREKPRQTASSLEAPVTMPRTSRRPSLSRLTETRTLRSLGGMARVGSGPGGGAPHNLDGAGGSIDGDRCGQAAAGGDRLPIGGQSIRRNVGIPPKAGPCLFNRASYGGGASHAPLRRDLLNRLPVRHVNWTY